MVSKTEDLLPGRIYHIYNRANGDEILFATGNNYLFFLKRYDKYLRNFLDTFCYCLMPNHFHFLVRVKDAERMDTSSFKGFTKNSKPYLDLSEVEKEAFISQTISQQFSNLFNSYSKTFNKQENRTGSLFMRPFKRKIVKDEAYLRKLVHYIHFNPQDAGIVDDHGTWRYSSYQAIISNANTNICRNEVITLFDNLENFKYIHKVQPKISGIEDW